jgi:hypothetical protein
MTTSITKKILMAGLCAATLGGSMISFSDSAEARYYRRGNGGAVAAGVVGGLALGALAAGAASNAYAAPVAPGYAYPAYGRPAYYGGGCYEVSRRYVDDWGRRFTRRETVCE